MRVKTDPIMIKPII